MVYNTLNGLALKYLSDLFIGNSENHLRVLRNTSTGLQLLKKTSRNGEKENIKKWAKMLLPKRCPIMECSSS